MYYNKYTLMQTNNNSLFLNEKTAEILTKIENITDKNGNIFLVNLWKNYIINKKESYMQILNDCEQFVNTIEREIENKNEMSSDNPLMQELSSDTVVLLYSFINVVNNRHIEM